MWYDFLPSKGKTLATGEEQCTDLGRYGPGALGTATFLVSLEQEGYKWWTLIKSFLASSGKQWEMRTSWSVYSSPPQGHPGLRPLCVTQTKGQQRFGLRVWVAAAEKPQTCWSNQDPEEGFCPTSDGNLLYSSTCWHLKDIRKGRRVLLQRLLSMQRPIFKALILPSAGTPSESYYCLGGSHLERPSHHRRGSSALKFLTRDGPNLLFAFHFLAGWSLLIAKCLVGANLFWEAEAVQVRARFAGHWWEVRLTERATVR